MVLFSRRLAAPKPHVVVLGKWTSVKWQAGDDEGKPVDVKIRPLYVDGRTKEFTLGPTHDVTDRAFVVQRMFRLNDSLPQDAGPARWRWQWGGWLLADRVTGKVQQITLPEFDPYYSAVNWFRDYAAYWSFRRGQQSFRHDRTTGQEEAAVEETRERCRSRDAWMPFAGMAAWPGTRDL